MTPYRFTSSALGEVKEATLHYAAKEPGLEESSWMRLMLPLLGFAPPLAWHPLSPRTRRCRTHRFPFGIIYQIRRDEILIVSVMDLRRDPIGWKYVLRG